MLIEMSAYVGDVMSFYIDQQYREMMLPLAEERRNVINIAKMLGYRVKPTSPAYVDLTVTQLVDAVVTDVNNIVPNYNQALAEIDKKLPDVAIIDVKLDKGDNDGIELLNHIKNKLN